MGRQELYGCNHTYFFSSPFLEYFTWLVISVFINNSLVHLNGMYNKSTNNAISRRRMHRAVGIVATRTFDQPSHRLENEDIDTRSGAGDKVALEPVPTSDEEDEQKNTLSWINAKVSVTFRRKHEQWRWFPIGRTKWIPPTNYVTSADCMCYTPEPIMGFLFNFCLVECNSPSTESTLWFSSRRKVKRRIIARITCWRWPTADKLSATRKLLFRNEVVAKMRWQYKIFSAGMANVWRELSCLAVSVSFYATFYCWCRVHCRDSTLSSDDSYGLHPSTAHVFLRLCVSAQFPFRE